MVAAAQVFAQHELGAKQAVGFGPGRDGAVDDARESNDRDCFLVRQGVNERPGQDLRAIGGSRERVGFVLEVEEVGLDAQGPVLVEPGAAAEEGAAAHAGVGRGVAEEDGGARSAEEAGVGAGGAGRAGGDKRWQ